MKTSAISRRSLVGLGAASALGVSLFERWAAAGTPALAGKNPKPARACILLYMAGGPSHIDTFDPKPGRPTGGPFKAIGTNLAGVQVSEHLPKLARQMNRLALIRSLTSKEGNHDRARHLMHTSYPPQGGVQHPCVGSYFAEARGDNGMPGYVAIGGPGESAGFLGARFSPFPVRKANQPVRYLAPAKGIDQARFERRLGLWRSLEDRFARVGGDYARSQRQLTEQAVSLMRSTGVNAFHLDSEASAVKEAYGTHEFGLGCLMARRLVEAGVPFVEVMMNGWDTHENNFERVKEQSTILDQGMSALLDDLAARGLLESTLVLWMGDFGRTPRINERGGRDHFPACNTVMLAGGGVKVGQVIGSSNEDAAEPRDRPVTVPDLFRTIAHLLDLDPDRMRVAPSGRPIKVVNGGALMHELV
jgi:hypothetical protein